MGKYDSRNGQAQRLSAHALTPGLSYVPTVCRSVLAVDEETVSEPEFVTHLADTLDGESAWDVALAGIDEDLEEPLPVPELEEEARTVPRTTQMQPIQGATTFVVQRPAPRATPLIDPLAMLEAATIRNVPRTRR